MTWPEGQLSFTCSTVLDRVLIHDVNGWYRSLGVDPRASRREIAAAYQEAGGHTSVWLTHILKSLFDREVRLQYDRSPLGTRYLDQYEIDRLESILDSREPESLRDLISSLDREDPIVHDGDSTGWAVFNPDGLQIDQQTADSWRSCVADAFISASGQGIRCGIGFHSGGPAVAVLSVAGVTVFSLDHTIQPTSHLALHALFGTTTSQNLELSDMSTEEEFDGLDFSNSYGGQVAEKSQKKRASSDSTDRFSIEDGETVIVRFASDSPETPSTSNPALIPWITCLMHNNVPTRAKPADFSGNWPSHMTGACRRDKIFTRKYNGECPICDLGLKTDKGRPATPAPRQFALVIMREEVRDPDTKKIVGYKTLKKKVTVDEQEIDLPDIRSLNMGWKNFFATMTGIADRFGSVVDRDIAITRKGTSTATDYQIVSLDKVIRPDGSVFDLSVPEELGKVFPYDEKTGKFKGFPDLRKIVAQNASDEHYGFWFGLGDGAEAAASRPSSSGGSQPAGQPAAPEPDSGAAERLEALRARVSSRGSAPKPAEEPQNQAGPADINSTENEPTPEAESSGLQSFD